MNYTEYRSFDATGLAELVARREVSPTELLDVAIERAEQVNGRINAIVRPMYDIARTRSRGELSGPLAGVPFLIKDLMQDYAGLPTGGGSRALRNQVAPDHSAVVERWLDAGLVIFGKTNTPEFGAKGITKPEVHGPTRNPWHLDHTPGGSSGGSAAAVAAGIVPVAGANDGGGSIRIPAACCGLFGLKPGRGLVPCGPRHAEYLHGAATDGVVSRTVRDTALMLDILTTRPDPGGPYLSARPNESYRELARRTPTRLRVGYPTRSPIDTPVHAESVAAVDHTVALLTRLGHDVEPVEFELDGQRMAADFLTMWYTEIASTTAEAEHITGAHATEFELDTRLLAAAGRALKAPDYAAAHHRWNDYTRTLAAFHENYDLLLTPTLGHPPIRIGQLETPALLRFLGTTLLRLGLAGPLTKSTPWKQTVLANLASVPFTQLANITGRPAMSVPLYRLPHGLPLGVQFIGGLGSEPTLLALATQLESESPWAHHEPAL
ncbi:amidase [Nocardia sp. NBC_01009]|uniref:amidase n=1 Tax=Nocardia sp. NBC_01009 TaxID=2975996 RepID=UPI003865CD5F|nr:amidase [Nocardia sp. NBC_01009]